MSSWNGACKELVEDDEIQINNTVNQSINQRNKILGKLLPGPNGAIRSTVPAALRPFRTTSVTGV